MTGNSNGNKIFVKAMRYRDAAVCLKSSIVSEIANIITARIDAPSPAVALVTK